MLNRAIVLVTLIFYSAALTVSSHEQCPLYPVAGKPTSVFLHVLICVAK